MTVSKVHERSFLKKDHIIKKPHLSQREDRSLKRISHFRFDMWAVEIANFENNALGLKKKHTHSTIFPFLLNRKFS